MKLIYSLTAASLLFASPSSAWNLREKDTHSTTFNLMEHEDGSVHMFEEKNKYAVGMLGADLPAVSSRVFKVHGNQQITGTLEVDGGIRLKDDKFNILDGSGNVIFDIDHNASGTMIEMGADGQHQIEARSFNSKETNGIYACSICHEKIPDEDADDNNDGQSNGLRFATEKMVRSYVSLPLDAVNMASSLDVVGDTSVSTFDSSGASSLATAGGAVNLASAGAATTIKGSLQADEAAVLSSSLDVTGDTSVSTFDSSGASSLATAGGAVDIASAGAATTINGNLNVAQAAVLSASLDVTGDTSVSTFDSSGASSLATAGGAVDIASAGAATTIKGSLQVDQAAVLSSSLDVTGDTSVSTFDSSGASSLATGGAVVNINAAGSATNVLGSLDVDQAADIQGAANFQSTLDVDGKATLKDNLDVVGQSDVQGAANFQSTVDISGKATLSDELAVSGAAEFDSSIGADGDLRVGAAGASLFNASATDGGAYSALDISPTSLNSQLVNFGSLKAQGEARYEYMFQVLCNTLGLDFGAIETGYTAAIGNGYATDGSGTTSDKFGGINPEESEIGSPVDDASVYNSYA